MGWERNGKMYYVHTVCGWQIDDWQFRVLMRMFCDIAASSCLCLCDVGGIEIRLVGSKISFIATCDVDTLVLPICVQSKDTALFLVLDGLTLA